MLILGEIETVRDTSGPLNHYGSAVLKTEKRRVKTEKHKIIMGSAVEEIKKEKEESPMHIFMGSL